MTLKRLSLALGSVFLLVPGSTLALQERSITVPGLNPVFFDLMNNIVSFLAYTAGSVCTALFLIGAYMMVLYAYDENKVKTGKDLMTGALLGLVVILGAYGILRTALWLIY